MVLDPGAGREAGDRLTEKIVGKSECVKCIPKHCQEEVEGHLGVQFGLEKGYFVFYGSMLCFIFSLPTLPAVNFLSHLAFFLQMDLCRVEAVDFGRMRMRNTLPGKPTAYGKARGRMIWHFLGCDLGECAWRAPV